MLFILKIKIYYISHNIYYLYCLILYFLFLIYTSTFFSFAFHQLSRAHRTKHLTGVQQLYTFCVSLMRKCLPPLPLLSGGCYRTNHSGSGIESAARYSQTARHQIQHRMQQGGRI